MLQTTLEYLVATWVGIDWHVDVMNSVLVSVQAARAGCFSKPQPLRGHSRTGGPQRGEGSASFSGTRLQGGGNV